MAVSRARDSKPRAGRWRAASSEHRRFDCSERSMGALGSQSSRRRELAHIFNGYLGMEMACSVHQESQNTRRNDPLSFCLLFDPANRLRKGCDLPALITHPFQAGVCGLCASITGFRQLSGSVRIPSHYALRVMSQSASRAWSGWPRNASMACITRHGIPSGLRLAHQLAAAARTKSGCVVKRGALSAMTSKLQALRNPSEGQQRCG